MEKEFQQDPSIGKLIFDTVVDTFKGALQGEYNEDPSTGEILIDTAIGMIPIAGEISDIRDQSAIVGFCSEFPNEMKIPWNWISASGSLFGLVPVFGGAFKGVLKGIQASSAKKIIETGSFSDEIGSKVVVRHAVTNKAAVQSIIDAINPKFFNPNSRFGRAFYVTERGETAVAEVTSHIKYKNANKLDTFDDYEKAVQEYIYQGFPEKEARNNAFGELGEIGQEVKKLVDEGFTPSKAIDKVIEKDTVKSVIRFDLNYNPQKFLDLSNPSTRKAWGYDKDTSNYDLTKQIAERAREAGFIGIKFPSTKGAGNNYAIFEIEDYSEVLKPSGVSPGKTPNWITIK